MDVRLLLGLLVPFLKEVIFGKSADEDAATKKKWHNKVMSFIMGSRRATALLIVGFTLAVIIDVVAIQKLASLALSRERGDSHGQICPAPEATKDLIVDDGAVFLDDLDHEKARSLVLRHLDG